MLYGYATWNILCSVCPDVWVIDNKLGICYIKESI